MMDEGQNKNQMKMDAILLDKNTIEYYHELYQPNNIPQSTREPNIVD